MSTLYIPVGIPGSGKSTWSRTQTDIVIVSSDSIRKEFVADLREAHGPDAPIDNGKVFQIFHERIRAGLIHDMNVFADATNVTYRSRENLFDIANEMDSRIHLIVFTNIEAGVERNKQRPAEQVVPDRAMERMIQNFYSFMEAPRISTTTTTYITD